MSFVPKGYSEHFGPEMIMHIGCIAVETAHLDMLLGMLLSRYSNEGEIIFADKNFSFDTRIKGKTLLSHDIDAQTRKALADLPWILGERNLFIHGVLVHTKNGSPDTLHFAASFTAQIPQSRLRGRQSF